MKGAAVRAIAATLEARHIPRSPGQYAVLDASGSLVSLAYSTLKDAAAAREALAEREADRRGLKIRVCLCCRTDFESEGIHNRMCGRCRRSSMTEGFDSPGQRPSLPRRRGA